MVLKVFDSNANDLLCFIAKELKKMNQSISDLNTFIVSALSSINASLDNIQADESALLAKITELTNSNSLSAEDLAALSAIQSGAQALVDRTKAVADAVPDAPPPVV